MPSLTKSISQALLLVVGFALVLKALDHLPAILGGTPHGVRVYATVGDAERALGVRILVPTEYPASVVRPPERVDAWPGPPLSVAVRFRDMADGTDTLVVAQTIDRLSPVPAILLPPVEVLTTVGVAVGRHSATLTRALAAGGGILHDLTWDQGTRRLTLRYTGPVEDLILIAANLERSEP